MRIIHTSHAIDRCREMGVDLSVVADIVRWPSLTYSSGQRKGQRGACTTAVSDRHPDYAVVFQSDAEVVRIVTVTFRTAEDYDRNGTTYSVRGEL